jgi:hypothetical protein
METEERYLEKPWIRLHEAIGLPKTLEYPEVAYTEFCLDKPAKRYPNNLALVCLDYEMTFKELKEHVDRFATGLSNLGIKKGRCRRNSSHLFDTILHSRICDTGDRCDTFGDKFIGFHRRFSRQIHPYEY